MAISIRSTTSYVQIDDIDLTENIRAPIAAVFRAMTTSKLADDWGGGPAKIQPRVHGKYSLWDGEMHGLIKEIEFPRRLVYTLRELQWEEGWLDSLVCWSLEEWEWGTRIALHHTGFPNRKIRELHAEGWGEYYIGPLKAFLERQTY